MAPTDSELIFWIIVGVFCLFVFIGMMLPLNPHYDPNGEDPYYYCPKE